MRRRETPVRPLYVRELTRYPVGVRRLRYLLMAVLASLMVRFMIVALLVLAPLVTGATGSWQPWLLIAMACNAALIAV
jgi:OPA family glycerol-3-phosphate transporter-like MFS transporter